MRRDPRSHAPSDHETCEHRPELANHRCRDEPPDVDRRAKGLELNRRLKGEHHTGEKTGEQNDAERLHPDLVHLLDQILGVEGTGENEAERLPGEREVLLDGQDLRLRGLVESRDEARPSRLLEPEGRRGAVTRRPRGRRHSLGLRHMMRSGTGRLGSRV